MKRSARTAIVSVTAVAALVVGATPALAATAVNGMVTSMNSGSMTMQTNGGQQAVDTSHAAVGQGVEQGAIAQAVGRMEHGTLVATRVTALSNG